MSRSEAAGALALACRAHAQLNDKAMMRGKPLTMDDYLASPFITEPLRKLDCCVETDCAAAVIVTSAERAKDLPHVPVTILGGAEGHPNRPGRARSIARDVLDLGLHLAAPRAFRMAGVTPGGHGLPAGLRLLHVCRAAGARSAGLCKRGEATGFVKDGNIQLGGKFPLNTHGGLMSAGALLGHEPHRRSHGSCA